MDKITPHFTWKEALFLPQYNRQANETQDGLTEEIKANLIKTFEKLEAIREFLGVPISVHIAYRSPAYNKLIGGAKNSAHLKGCAIDWHAQGITCDEVRKKLLDANKLEELQIRMEDNPGSNWVHIDTYPPKPNRFFKP